MPQPAIFISYRRDDCPGYAGRLEEVLERKYGADTVFRDIGDIPAGESFADVIAARLSASSIVLVLIGPRWAGVRADGTRRIDEDNDFVRMEASVALQSAGTVVPVLLAGAAPPHPDELPESLRPLAQRLAVSLDEDSWDADVARLTASLRLPRLRRRRRQIAAATFAMMVLAIAVTYVYKSALPGIAADRSVEAVIGTWQARVRYGWGDEYEERFAFERFAGSVTGTATFLGYPRGIEDFAAAGEGINFVTHTTQTMDAQDRTLTHRYTVAMGGGRLQVRMQTTGGFDSYPPLHFTAQRVEISTQTSSESAKTR